MAFGAELGLIGSLVSGVVGFVGQMQQASAQADAAKYQAAVARNNQIIAQQNASYATQAGAVESQARDRRNAAVAGSILAAQGASGVDIESTTSREVRESQAQLGRLDTQTIMQRALLQSRSYTAEAANQGAEAQLATQRASSATTGGLFGGLGSLLGGATSFSEKWQKYQLSGVGLGSSGTGGIF
jgi:hypothetical protein